MTRSDSPRAPRGASPIDGFGHRRIRLWHFFALVIAYVVLAQVVTLVLTAGQDGDHGALTSNDALVTRVIVPVGLAMFVAIAVVAWFGSWQSIFVERRRLAAIAWVIPILLVITAVVVTNYAGLGERGLAFAGLLFVGTMMVGFAEELVFRGVGVQAFRQGGFSEIQVALWTSVIFGVSHGTNAFVTGDVVNALIQVVLTTGTGFVFYLIMRGTGALAMAMLFHGLWDFSVLSTQVDPADATPMANIAAVVLGVILLGVLLFRKRLGLAAAS